MGMNKLQESGNDGREQHQTGPRQVSDGASRIVDPSDMLVNKTQAHTGMEKAAIATLAREKRQQREMHGRRWQRPSLRFITMAGFYPDPRWSRK